MPMVARTGLAPYEWRKIVARFALLLLTFASILFCWHYILLTREANRLEHLNNMADVALELKRATLALKALGPEGVVMDGNQPIFARAQWLRFKAYSQLKDVPQAQRCAVDSLMLSPPGLAHQRKLEFGLWRLEADLDLHETQRLLVEGLLESPVFGGLQDHSLLVLLNLPSPNETSFQQIADAIRTGTRVFDPDRQLSHHVIGSLYGMLQNTAAMLHYFGMTCKCVHEHGKLSYRAFGPEVAQAYEKQQLDPSMLPHVSPDSVPRHIFLSKPLVPIEAVQHLEKFFLSSPTFWPSGERSHSAPFSHFRGHLRVLAASETSLVDSMIAAMHFQLPARLRELATHAEWWSHARPIQTYDGQRQFFQGHACHTDNYDHDEGVPLATSVLYLSDSSAATLILNQSTKSMDEDPVAWVVHPKQSFMVTYDAELWHCVLPPRGLEVGPLRASLNVLWLSQVCTSDENKPEHCQHRPSIGWPWEAEVEVANWSSSVGSEDPRFWVPNPVRAFARSNFTSSARSSFYDL